MGKKRNGKKRQQKWGGHTGPYTQEHWDGGPPSPHEDTTENILARLERWAKSEGRVVAYRPKTDDFDGAIIWVRCHVLPQEIDEVNVKSTPPPNEVLQIPRIEKDLLPFN